MMRRTPEPQEIGKLRWRCRRGMKELDVLLSRYLDQEYSSASPVHRQAFRELLDSQDPLIHAYFLGMQAPPNAVVSALIERITQSPSNDRY
jgi:antitoxin CptB